MKLKTENKRFIFDQPKITGFKFYLKKCLVAVYCALKKMHMDLFHHNKAQQKKFNVSICAIFKNEANYLKEWIEFHKIVGIEHFYMYNNNSEDGFKKALSPYIEEGTVTLVNWTKNQAQMEAYRDAAKRFGSETKWLGFIDIDEFVNPIKYDNVYDFLRKFEKNRGAVMIYWKIFGASGMLERDLNGLVTEDFTVCWNKHSNIGKCFLNTEYQLSDKRNETLHHCMWTKRHRMLLPPVNQFGAVSAFGRNIATSDEFDIQINHYFTKSYQEYLNKKSKGDVYFQINPHDEEYFYEHEMKCTSVDFSIYKYIVKLKEKLK